MKNLNLTELKSAARVFLKQLSNTPTSELYGVDNGKTIGTFVEHSFHTHLKEKYAYSPGSSARGIDFPELDVDLKVTSIKQPQSSCPFNDASQKVYGLGYHLLVFVYEKIDDDSSKTAKLSFQHAVFVSSERTADYQTTSGLRGILARQGNLDDVIAFLEEPNFPLDEIGRKTLAARILKELPEIGYLTVSNALQWWLQYGRVLDLSKSGEAEGVENILG